MGASETHELIVQMRPEGMGETEEGLDQVDQSFDETADSVDQSADEMEGFAQQWDGAMGAVVAGLAVASAGLLSQVPVIGEAMSGLFAVVEAVAYQMDQVLRPILQPVTDAFFGLSTAIFEAEGPLGILIGLIGTAIVLLTGIAAASVLASTAAGGLSTAWTGLTAATGALTTALSALAAALGISTLAAGALVAAIAALAAIILLDIGGIRSAFTGLVDDAFTWGVDLMAEFANGIISNATAPIDAVSGVFDDVMSLIGFDIRANDRMAQRWGEDMVMHFGQGMDRGRKNALPDVLGGSDGGGGGGSPPPAGSRTPPQFFFDGRQVNKASKKHRDRDIKRRGRYG